MRKLLVACGALAAMMFAACAPSPPELCKRGIALTCDRTFECSDQATKDSTVFQGIFGTSAADCKTKMETASDCANKKAENDLCTGGKTYHLDKAATCSDKVKAMSCADFKDYANKAPAECSQVCT